MKEYERQLAAVTRGVTVRRTEWGEREVLVFARNYEAQIAEVWDALTSPQRLRRWFGGWIDPGPKEEMLQMAAQEDEPDVEDSPLMREALGFFAYPPLLPAYIRICEPPCRLVFDVYPLMPEERVSDAQLEAMAERVDVRLAPDGKRTEFTVRSDYGVHPVFLRGLAGPMWPGMELDMSLLALGRHLRGKTVKPGCQWQDSAQGRQAMAQSVTAWVRLSTIGVVILPSRPALS